MIFILLLSHLSSCCGIKKPNRGVQEGGTNYLVLRPLRFRDGTPHPHALVPKMRFPVMGVSVLHIKGVHVLGDYLLLWIVKANEGYSVAKLYAVAWKQGSITLVSSVFFIHDHLSHCPWY
jgi:hypothetical protein